MWLDVAVNQRRVAAMEIADDVEQAGRPARDVAEVIAVASSGTITLVGTAMGFYFGRTMK